MMHWRTPDGPSQAKTESIWLYDPPVSLKSDKPRFVMEFRSRIRVNYGSGPSIHSLHIRLHPEVSMRAHYRRLTLGLIAIAVLSAAIGLSRREPTVSADSLKATGPLRWYRGNMHTHSNWSDGDDFLEMIALWYRDRQYDFLCFTDHNLLADRERWVIVDRIKGGAKAYKKLKEKFPSGWIDERVNEEGLVEVRLKRFDEVVQKIGDPGKFLLIQSEEISDKFGKHPIHLNAHNLREVITPRGGDSVHEVIQNNIDAVVRQREQTGQPMIAHINHPNFGWGIAAEDLMPIRGDKFFEVYNGHPTVHNDGDFIHCSTERIWDIVNSMRLTEFELPLMYGLATDDGHEYHLIPSRGSEPGRGWVMVLAEDLTPASLIQSMEAGRFYASSGVTLDEVTTTAQSLTVSVRPDTECEYRIDFIGTNKGFNHHSDPVRDLNGRRLPVTRRYTSEIGKILKTENKASATYEFTGNELFVRARVTSSRRHPNPSAPGEFERAWTQPVRPGQ